MTTVWPVVGACGVLTIIIKGLGPVAIGDRPTPARLAAVLSLVGPALLTALVVTGVFDGHRRLVVDARFAGVIVAVVGAWRRLPPLVVVVAAAAVTAGIRAVA